MSQRQPIAWIQLLKTLALTMVAACAAAAPARAAVYNDIEVTAVPLAMPEAASTFESQGYLEQRIVVRNRSKSTTHVVRLTQYSDNSHYYDDYLQRNSRTVQIGPEASMTVSLVLPGVLPVDDRLVVSVDGREQMERIVLAVPHGGYRYSGYGRVDENLGVLAGRSIPQDWKDKVRSSAKQVNFCRAELPVTEWSANWIGYTAYDAVLLTSRELDTAGADVLLALRRYVEAGGVLMVHGPKSDDPKVVPEPWRDARLKSDKAGHFHIGLGVVCAANSFTNWPRQVWNTSRRQSQIARNHSFQVVSDVDVPVRGMLLLVVAFAVGIGPINLWLLSRSQRRIWLWWNVPVASFVTCLAVFCYSVFSEGISGRGKTGLITLLDQREHRATTFGYASYYCPLTPSSGLHLSFDTVVTPLKIEQDFNWYGPQRGRGKSADWTVDQHLDAGWIAARLPANFTVRKNEARRERLAVRKDANGALVVVNGLGVDIDALYYVDDDGKVGIAKNIPAGQERTLNPGPTTQPPALDAAVEVGSLFDMNWEQAIGTLRRYPERHVARGCYVAEVSKNPFFEDPLSLGTHEGSVGLVYGTGAGSSDGR